MAMPLSSLIPGPHSPSDNVLDSSFSGQARPRWSELKRNWWILGLLISYLLWFLSLSLMMEWIILDKNPISWIYPDIISSLIWFISIQFLLTQRLSKVIGYSHTIHSQNLC